MGCNHFVSFWDGRARSSAFESVEMSGKVCPTPQFRAEGRDRGNRNVDKVCHRRGHWKADCSRIES